MGALAERPQNIKNLIIESPNSELPVFIPSEQFSGEEFGELSTYLNFGWTAEELPTHYTEMAYEMSVMLGKSMPPLGDAAKKLITEKCADRVKLGWLNAVTAALHMQELNPQEFERVRPDGQITASIRQVFSMWRERSNIPLEALAQLKVVMPEMYEELKVDPDYLMGVFAAHRDKALAVSDAAAIRIMFPEIPAAKLFKRGELLNYMGDFEATKRMKIFIGAVRWAYYFSIITAPQIDIKDGRLVLGYDKEFRQDTNMALPQMRRF